MNGMSSNRRGRTSRSSAVLTAVLVLLAGADSFAGGKRYWKGPTPRRYTPRAPLLRDLPSGRVVKSWIKRVEVYLGRAMIEREAIVELKAGGHRLVFPALPWDLEASTLNIGGFGSDAVAGSTFLEEGTMVEARPRRLLALEKTLAALERKDRELAARDTILDSERRIMMRALSKATERLEAVRSALRFARDELRRITRARADVARQRGALAPTLAKARKAHATLLLSLQRRVRHVVVEVRARRTHRLKLKIRYVVRGPAWKPRHEARYDPVRRKLRIDTFAWVVQKTGESWSKVAIRVSNARATTGLLPPTPRGRQVNLEASGARQAGISSRLREVAVHASGSATHSVRFFTPPGRHTVPSGPRGRRVLVATVEMNAGGRHITTPMDHPGAYLELTVTNPGAVPILAGEGALFNGPDYVGTAKIPVVLPKERLVLPFGRDPGVVVSRRRIRRAHRTIRGRQLLQVAYRFEVKNNLAHPVQLSLQEVSPTAGNRRVRVKVNRGTPIPKPGPRRSAPGLLIWTMQIGAKGSKAWTWGYEVSAPAGQRIVGVD